MVLQDRLCSCRWKLKVRCADKTAQLTYSIKILGLHSIQTISSSQLKVTVMYTASALVAVLHSLLKLAKKNRKTRGVGKQWNISSWKEKNTK